MTRYFIWCGWREGGRSASYIRSFTKMNELIFASIAARTLIWLASLADESSIRQLLYQKEIPCQHDTVFLFVAAF